MIDFTTFKSKDFLQTLKANDKYRSAIATKKTWEEVVEVIDSLDVKYTEEQINYVKEKQWN